MTGLRSQFHRNEAARIKQELAALSTFFTEDGIVRYVLKKRIAGELRRAEHGCDERCSCPEDAE